MAVADAPRKTRAAAVREAARARLAAALKSTRLTDAYRQRRLTGDQRRRLYARLVVAGQKDFRALARRATSSELSGAEWRRAMRRGVEVLHHAAALAGSDTGTLSRGDITLLNRQTGEQWAYLDAFRHALESDDLTPKQAAARAANYARAAWGIAENIRLDRMRRDGFKYVRRILGRVERHCSDCPRLARQGWLPIKQMTPLGNTSCSSGCNCHFEFSKARPKGYQAPKRKAAPRPKAPRPTPVPVPVPVAPIEDPRIVARRRRVEAELSRLVPEQERLTKAIELASGEDRQRLLSERTEVERLYNRLADWDDLRKTVPTLVPAGPIRDRIADYHEGDARLSAIRQAAESALAGKSALEKQQRELGRQIKAKLKAESSLLKRKLPPDEFTAEQTRLLKEVNRLHRERDALKAQVDEIDRQATAAARATIAADRPVAFTWRRVLTGARSADGPLAPPSETTARNLDEGMSWLSRVVARADGPETFLQTVGEGPGYRAHHADVDERADYNVQLGTGDSAATVVHEFGHGIEKGLGLGGESIQQRAQEYLRSRARTDRPTFRLYERFPDADYRDDERAFEADFARAFAGPDAERRGVYTAKDYASGSTEVISMGVEELYRDPAGFATRDPEYAKFILGILDGSLR